MITASAILSVLLAQPPCWADRDLPPETRLEQRQTIAQAIAATEPTPERAAMLLTIGYHESRWCQAVGSGAKRGGAGEGYWQLEGRHHGPAPRSGLSLEAVSSAASLASVQLQRSWQCGSSPAARLTAYAGRPCQTDWPTLRARVRGYWWALSALRRAGAK